MLERFKRNCMESIAIYFKSAKDMVIIGSYYEPQGPSRACGQPCVVDKILPAVKIGAILCDMYTICTHFTKADLTVQAAPHTQATGIKSWTKFAKGRKFIHIEWHRNGHIFLELWNWLPDGGFGPEESTIDNREVISGENLKQVLGETVLSMIEKSVS